MFATVIQDKTNRIAFSNLEPFSISSSLLKEVSFTRNITYFFFKRQSTVSFFTKIRNRCVITTRAKAIHSKFRCSRIVLNTEILKRNVPGFYRAVW